MNTKRLVLISLAAALIFIQEQTLNFIPNVSFTFFLYLLYSRYFNLNEMVLLTLVFVFLDHTFYGGLNFIFYGFTVLAYLLIAVMFKKIQKRNIYIISIGAFFSGFLYSWILIIPGIIITKSSFSTYIIADLPFEMILSLSNFLITILLFERIVKILDKRINTKNN